jgi:Fe-S cluster assembly protein SufB
MATDARDLTIATPDRVDGTPDRVNVRPENVEIGSYKFGWHDPVTSVFEPKRGLSHDVVEEISAMKGEPEWMRQYRHKSLDYFYRKPMPSWGSDLSGIDFDNIFYFLRATEKQAESWEDLPDDIKNTYDRLGIPEAEKQRLVAGVAAQYESEVVYHKVREDLEAQGVVFMDTDTALREHEDTFREHWATVIPANDNKFSALNSAVWSGGSFVWVPEGVHVEIPLQAYFRINSQNMGQFERTMIIAEPGSSVHYVEGCTAPVYSSDSLHSAVVEIIVKPQAKVRYTTIQNWSNNVYNLVTKRAAAYEGATMEWIDGNIGSKVTMKYPAVLLLGEHAHGEILSVAFGGRGQHQDAGAKLTFAAPNTTGQIVSKSISRDTGRTSYRGLIKVEENAPGVKATVRCDALMLDDDSRSDTYPYMDIKQEDVTLGHEATVSKIGDDQLFYLQSRGLTEAEAAAMIVRGFVEPVAKELPMEYALELNRLIALQMEGAIG